MKNLKTFEEFLIESLKGGTVIEEDVNESLSAKDKKIIKSEVDWDGRILSRWQDEGYDDEVTALAMNQIIPMVGPDSDEFDNLYTKANDKKQREIERYFADLANES